MQLIEMIAGQTSVIAARLLEPHIGTLLMVSGTVKNVSEDYPGLMLVSMEAHDGSDLLLRFDSLWRQRLSVLNKEDDIKVRGEISRIELAMVVLEHCQLVE